MGKTTSLTAGLGLSGKAFNRKVRKERPPRTQDNQVAFRLIQVIK